MNNPVLSTEEYCGDVAHYQGVRNSKNSIIIIGRDNVSKDTILIQNLIDSLHQKDWLIVWYEHRGAIVAKWLIEKSDKILGDYKSNLWLVKITKTLVLLTHPWKWDYFLDMAFKNTWIISYRAKKLAMFIRNLGLDKNVFIVARSAGGRVASLVENESTVRKIVSMAYPFKHPQKPEESMRTKPLATLKKPFLIFQGEHDEYGGREVLEKYPFSPQVRIEFLNTDHDFHLDDTTWNNVIIKMKEFFNLQN